MTWEDGDQILWQGEWIDVNEANMTSSFSQPDAVQPQLPFE